MDTYELLTEAIHQKLQVVAVYDGRERVFCPHALGTKRGTPHVLVYQFAGESKSGLPSGGEWRCLDVDALKNAYLQVGAWYSAPNVFNPQSCMDQIDLVATPLPPIPPAPVVEREAEA
ncbi:MAG TPA: hypothetical protein VFL82_01180 [Thermomicrobiales bacterium]|nr:hypothetical protein [Thermomicrobiales bacterium]